MWIDRANLIQLPTKKKADTPRWSEKYHPARFIPHCCPLLPRNCPGLKSMSSFHRCLLRHIPSSTRTPPGSRTGCYYFGGTPLHPRWTKIGINHVPSLFMHLQRARKALLPLCWCICRTRTSQHVSWLAKVWMYSLKSINRLEVDAAVNKEGEDVEKAHRWQTISIRKSKGWGCNITLISQQRRGEFCELKQGN